MLAIFNELQSVDALRETKTMLILLHNGKMQLIFGQNWARKYAIRDVCSCSLGFYNVLFGMIFLISCGIDYLLTLSK